MDGVGDGAGGCGVDGRAVDEEAVGIGGWELRVEDLAEDGFDVRGFGEDGYSGLLCRLVSSCW